MINSRVRSIKQDSKGRIMFLTFGGLSIYDGVKFKNYSQQNGLANDLVNDVFEISPDSLLIATNAPALNVMVDGEVKPYLTADGFYPIINRFLKSKDGSLYAAADGGLFRMSDHKFIRIPLLNPNGEDIGLNLDKIMEWNQYLFLIPWNIPQKEKLIIYDKERKIIAGTITDKGIIGTGISPNQEIWISSTSGVELLDLAELQKGKIKLTPLKLDLGKVWKSSFIYFDPGGAAWVFINNEAVRYSVSGEKQFLSPLHGLKTSSLTDIFVDREGIVWMASDGNGAIKLPGSNIQILNELVPGVKNNVTALHQQSDTTWLFNNTDNSIYRIYHDHVTPFSLGSELFNVFNLYLTGESLYFSANNNIYYIDRKDKASAYLHPHVIFPHHFRLKELGVGLSDPNGNIIQMIWEDETTFYLAVIKDQKLMMKHPVSSLVDHMVLDKNGYLWAPLRNNRLLKFSLHPENPAQYLQLEYDYADQIAGIDPRSVTIDRDGDVWIGTRFNGIYKYHFEGDKIKSSQQFTTAQGLTDNFEYYLYCDSNNSIWAGSQTGLDKIFFKDGQYLIDNITKSKGIFQGIYKITNVNEDELWAMTTNGNLLSIEGDAMPSADTPPQLLLTGLSVNNEEHDVNASVFTYDHNNLSISVAACSFLDEKSIQYSYLLEGGSKTSWSIPSNDAHFDLINLAPGSYTLYIKAQFPAHVYPEQTLQYFFTIKPPFWKTIWFLSIAVLCILFLLGLMVRAYYSRKLERQKIFLENQRTLEKERTRIATDMHDDLGAGLSRIKFLSEIIAIKKQKHLPIDEEITNISHHSHEMIDKMGEIVWALNEKNDSLSDLLSYTRAYAVAYLAENGIKSSVEKISDHGNMTVNGEFRRNIYLSVKESLHNIVKHSRADHVSMQFKSDGYLVIVIHDNGIGFDPDNIPSFRNGLHNITKRMKDIEGQVDIANEHGTKVTLTAPLVV